jgi:hypothetical protein
VRENIIDSPARVETLAALFDPSAIVVLCGDGVLKSGTCERYNYIVCVHRSKTLRLEIRINEVGKPKGVFGFKKMEELSAE